MCNLLCGRGQEKGPPKGELASLVESALGLIGAAAIPAVQQLLVDLDHSVRIAALSTLGRMGPTALPALPAIIESLNDEDQLVCCKALATLGNFGTAANTAIPAIIRALEDEDWLIRSNTRRALERIDRQPQVIVVGKTRT